MLLRRRPNASERKLAANRRNALKSTGPRPSEGKRRAPQRLEARAACPDVGGRFAGSIAQSTCARWRGSEKRVSNFDEQSHYVIENTRSDLRTKPNEANFFGGENVWCGGGVGLSRRAGGRLIRVGRGDLRAPDDAGAGTAPLPKQECQAEGRDYAAKRTGRMPMLRGTVCRYHRAMRWHAANLATETPNALAIRIARSYGGLERRPSPRRCGSGLHPFPAWPAGSRNRNSGRSSSPPGL